MIWVEGEERMWSETCHNDKSGRCRQKLQYRKSTRAGMKEKLKVILAEPATMTSRAVHEELETEGVMERKKWEGASGRRDLPQ